MATVVGRVLRGALDQADAAVGEEAQQDAVSVAAPASSSSRSRAPVAAPSSSICTSLAAGRPVQQAAVSEAWSSSSRPLPSAAVPSSSSSLLPVRSLAGSLPPATALFSSRSPPLAAANQAQQAAASDGASSSARSPLPAAEPTWVILGRVLLVNFVAEGEVAGSEAQAHHAAADFTLPLAPPPRVTVLSAGRSAHPDPSNPDRCPYIVSAAPCCLLAHFAQPPSTSHLVALREFHTAEGHTTATAERVRDRSCFVPMMMNLGSVAVCSNENDYTIYELQVHQGDSSARLISLESGRSNWDWKDVRCPLPAGDRVWVPHGTAADDHQKLFWFDLSWGVLSYDASSQARDPRLMFHLLPEDRDLGEATLGIHNHRNITLSKNELRYVEIIPQGGSARFRMWTWSRVSGEWQWERTYSIIMDQIWDDNSYQNTNLPREVPVIVAVCPLDPELVYLSLDHYIIGVNVPVCRVVGFEACQLENMPWPVSTATASSRHLIAWVLPPGLVQGLKLAEPSDFPLSTELVGVIANFLHCSISRLFLSMVCREWRAEIMLLKPLPKYLPGLLLPYHNFRTLSLNETQKEGTGSLICLTCCTAHPFRRPALMDGARFIGSYEGGWVFTAYCQYTCHALINMNTGGEPILLPDHMKIFGGLQLRIIIRAATLSSPPNMNGCIGAAIVSTCWSDRPSDYVVLWHIGSRVMSYAKEIIAEDILFMNGAFYIMLKNGDITVCTPEVDECFSLNELDVTMKDLHFHTIDTNDEVYLSRYLVEWKGDLLMVVRRRRLAGPISSMPRSYSFQVFRMTAFQNKENGQLNNNEEYFWDSVEALGGLIIFIGRGCSRCYSAEWSPGVQCGIYYHDEDFYETDMIWSDKERKYPCYDNGLCKDLRNGVEPKFTELIPSTFSFPIWFLH